MCAMEALQTLGWKTTSAESSSSRGRATSGRSRRSPSVAASTWTQGLAVVPIGGAQSVGRYLRHFGPEGLDVTLGALRRREEREFRRGLERAGIGSDLTRARMEALGFYVLDLEDELVRALGGATVESILEAQGEPVLPHLPEAAGASRSGARGAAAGLHDQPKIRYARLLVEALDLARAAAARPGPRSRHGP